MRLFQHAFVFLLAYGLSICLLYLFRRSIKRGVSVYFETKYYREADPVPFWIRTAYLGVLGLGLLIFISYLLFLDLTGQVP
ncbi:hypothetical protein GETHOR_13650 [Geothrix oryzae]|uniref:Uncharacterized protein n=1 Tax=Geothrix oryzae TaxID=2927975 RepID=A0ABM8DQM2_9BACT|nr:hypothetical protein GETHOR_13650 [Geothrix oryzae]